MALPEPPAASDVVHATFPGGSVVQLIAGDPSTEEALVAGLHPATIILSPDRVTAVEGDVEWSWAIRDLDHVHHSPVEEWTILAVPGVPDHGVVVARHQVHEFRELLDRVRGGGGAPAPDRRAEAEQLPSVPAADADRVLHLDDPAASSVIEVTPEPTPSPDLGGEASEVDLGPGFDLEEDDPAPLPAPVLPPPNRTALADERASAASGAPAAMVDEPSRKRRRRRPEPARSRVAAAVPPLATLRADSISAWFGSHHVLDRVSLTMHAGEVTALIGPSGCGKSTFLRILNRMHELIPSASLAGEVLLDGSDIYDVSRKLTEARRQIGMVFQKPNPFPAMSIYDNVVASFRLTGTKLSGSEKDDVVESCLSKAGLWNEVRDRLRQPGGGLSGGQQQRLCIARVLAIRPRVLLMDEPCSALDPTSTRRIEQTIVELRDEVTIVIVTHNMQQANRVSDQCAFFLAEAGTPGVIVEHGPTDAMFQHPQDERTLAYVNGRFG